MTVLSCSHCGAPRHPNAAQCEYCRTPFAATAGAPGAARVDPDIEALVRKQNLIGAIKIHRERYGTDLLTAKKAIEELKKRLGV